jgi:hypothetical protein
MRESPTIMMDIENAEWALQSDVALNAKGQEYRSGGVGRRPAQKRATSRGRKALAERAKGNE